MSTVLGYHRIRAYAENVIRIAHDIALELGPENKYQRIGGICLYVDPTTNGPSCIVGHILHRMGTSLDTLRENEGRTPGAPCKLFLDLPLVVREILNDIQEYQDSGSTFGECVQIGENVLNEWIQHPYDDQVPL